MTRQDILEFYNNAPSDIQFGFWFIVCVLAAVGMVQLANWLVAEGREWWK